MSTYRQRVRAIAASEPKPRQRVYFAQSGEDDGPVKIGVARDPVARLRELQVGNHEFLRLLGYTEECDAFKIEQRLHRQLHASCIRGEWFRISPDLFRVIDGLCGDENYLNGDARSMIGLMWPHGEDITPEMVRSGVVSLLRNRYEVAHV